MSDEKESGRSPGVNKKNLFENRGEEAEIIAYPYSDINPENRLAEKLMQFDRLVKNAKKRNFKIDKTIDVDELMNEMNNGLC